MATTRDLRLALIVALFTSTIVMLGTAGGQSSQQPLTAKDDIAYRRIVTSYSARVLVSPDQRKYVLALQSGDLSRNGSWIEFYVGQLTSRAAVPPVLASRLFTSSTAEAMELAKDIRWSPDSGDITFLWGDGTSPSQVMKLDVSTGTLSSLARAETSIYEYSVDEAGRKVIFTAGAEEKHTPICVNGGAITDEPIDKLLACDSVSAGRESPSEYLTYISDGRNTRKIAEPRMKWGVTPELLVISPDGRYAVAVRPSPVAPKSWDAYQNHILEGYLAAARESPSGPHLLRHFELIALGSATSRPLWDVPMNPYAYVVWSPDSRSVVVGPTFLPQPTTDADGLTGKAVAVVDVSTGRSTALPVHVQLENGLVPIRWTKDNVITLGDANEYRPTAIKSSLMKTKNGWEEVSKKVASPPPGVTLEVREDYNTPAAVYAVNRNGRVTKVFDPNPQFASHFRLGRTEMIHWKGADGRSWSGVATYPVDYEHGKSYPLVIQTHGFLKDMFPLSPAYLSSVFAAQELANAGILTVQIGAPDDYDSTKELSVPEEPEISEAGVEGLIADLTSKHIVDPAKVGMTGFSRTGWHVEYFLTHSKLHLAAAEIADSMDTGYFQYLLYSDQFRAEVDHDIGGAPMGDGLNQWIARSAPFRAERITTPLRIEADSAPMSIAALAHWDLFVLLRKLGRPVEYFIVPDIQHGVHVLQNPSQRLASMAGTVDWYHFWLKDEEDPDPAKAEQYKRWRELRKMQEENDKKAAAAAQWPSTN